MNLTAALRLHGLALLGFASTAAAAANAPRILLLDGATVGDAIVVVGERGTILRSTDQAHSWQPMAVPHATTLTGVSFAPASAQGWAVGHDALILATHDGGLTWQKQWQGENLQDSFLDTLALDAQHVIAVGAYGLCVTTNDGGKTWQRHKVIDDDFHLNRITRGPAGDLYIAGEHGTLLHSADQGASWKRLEAPYDGSFYGILPLDARTLVAYGLRGRIYRSTDQGATWTLVSNQQQVLIATALRLSNGTILFAGQSRSGAISRDNGATITSWTASASAVAELMELSDGSILVLGEAGAVRVPKP